LIKDVAAFLSENLPKKTTKILDKIRHLNYLFDALADAYLDEHIPADEAKNYFDCCVAIENYYNQESFKWCIEKIHIHSVLVDVYRKRGLLQEADNKCSATIKHCQQEILTAKPANKFYETNLKIELGHLYTKQKRFTAAVKVYEDLLLIAYDEYGMDYWPDNFIEVFKGLTECYVGLGNLSMAEKIRLEGTVIRYESSI
jgi:tetratricopeptide (TPR) repeat protein